MALNPAPIQQPLNSGGVPDPLWVRWFSSVLAAIRDVQESIPTIPATFPMVAGPAPTVTPGQALVWLANDAGTKDGQAYSQGDVLITSNVGGLSKTLLVLDWSAI